MNFDKWSWQPPLGHHKIWIPAAFPQPLNTHNPHFPQEWPHYFNPVAFHYSYPEPWPSTINLGDYYSQNYHQTPHGYGFTQPTPFTHIFPQRVYPQYYPSYMNAQTRPQTRQNYWRQRDDPPTSQMQHRQQGHARSVSSDCDLKKSQPGCKSRRLPPRQRGRKIKQETASRDHSRRSRSPRRSPAPRQRASDQQQPIRPKVPLSIERWLSEVTPASGLGEGGQGEKEIGSETLVGTPSHRTLTEIHDKQEEEWNENARRLEIEFLHTKEILRMKEKKKPVQKT